MLRNAQLLSTDLFDLILSVQLTFLEALFWFWAVVLLLESNEVVLLFVLRLDLSGSLLVILLIQDGVTIIIETRIKGYF